MNQDNNHIIELSMDDMLVERQPSRLPKRLLIASGVLVAAAFVLLTLYFSLLNKEINKGFFDIFDWTDDDYELDALDSDFVSLAYQFQANHDTRHLEVRAEDYLRDFYGLGKGERFPEAIPTIDSRMVEENRYTAVAPVAANALLYRYTGESHTVMEAYLSFWISNGQEERFLFYRETGTNYNDPEEYWMYLPMSSDAVDELMKLMEEYK